MSIFVPPGEVISKAAWPSHCTPMLGRLAGARSRWAAAGRGGGGGDGDQRRQAGAACADGRETGGHAKLRS